MSCSTRILVPDPLAEEIADKTGPFRGDFVRKSPRAAPPTQLDQELLEGLRDGEDVGDRSGNDPLSRLSRQMRNVEAT